MLIRVVSLAKCLLPSHLTVSEHSGSPTCSNRSKRAVRKDLRPAIQAFLFFLGTLLEEDLPEDVLFFLVRVVVLDIIVVGLIEHAVRVMVAVRILVPDSASLRHRGVRVDASDALHTCLHGILVLVVLASYQKNALVETTDHWYFWWLLHLFLRLFVNFKFPLALFKFLFLAGTFDLALASLLAFEILLFLILLDLRSLALRV